MKKVTTYGAEIEKAVSDKTTAAPHGVSQNYFKSLMQLGSSRGAIVTSHASDIKPDIVLGITSDDIGEQGVDNGINLLETSTIVHTSLASLKKTLDVDLQTTQEALAREDATVINFSIHPLGKRTLKEYTKFVVPKGVYSYLWYRGWDHTAGIDARAQNSPGTGVTVDTAADAVSVIIGAGAAFIGLFANSPFEAGKKSLYQESRLLIWDRMFGGSKVKSDLAVSEFPPKRFRTLAQYFTWMFGGSTAMHFVIASADNSDYKGIGNSLIVVEHNPSVFDYLSKPRWQGHYLSAMYQDFPPKVITLTPSITDMESMQWAQFAGARIRYKLKNHKEFPISTFLEACKLQESRKVEELFQEFTEYIYIEGRDPGANFPDEEVLAAGKEIAGSAVIAPSALQAGLLNNLTEAQQYVDSFQWQQLKALRSAAIKDGLAGQVDNTSVYEFAKRIYEIAASGLAQNDQPLLAYPEWVLRTKQNGADRALQFNGDLKKLIKIRTVITKY